MYDIFKGLNYEQKIAVKHIQGPMIILAGAGSGKTRVLIHKVINLINNHNINPKSIVMITFTNKAASEMQERFTTYSQNNKLGFIGTFHSFCARILRQDGKRIGIPSTFAIYDDYDQEQIIKNIIKNKQYRYTPKFYLSHISDAKNRLINSEKYLESYDFHNASYVSEVYSEYDRALKKNNALDFDDLIMRAMELFTIDSDMLNKYQKFYQYFFVDEFQDTNIAQYIFIKKLSNKLKNITVVGDFAQSIYSWRGANIKNLENFTQDYKDVQVIELHQNYRSTQNILDFAFKVISENQTHPTIALHTNNHKGADVEVIEVNNEQEEATLLANKIQTIANNTSYSEIAILYRTNAQSRIIEEYFMHFGIPYILVGGTKFYARKEVKDVLSYLRLLLHPTDTLSIKRVKKIGIKKYKLFQKLYSSIEDKVQSIPTLELMDMIFEQTNYLKKYDSENLEDYSRLENIQELQSVAASHTSLVDFLEQVALVESEYFEGEKNEQSQNGVKLMTLHRAKGLEFDHVFIIGLEEGLLPHLMSIDDLYKLEEERRLFYVGITRARKQLFVTYARSRLIFGYRNNTLKSRFISSNNDEYNE